MEGAEPVVEGKVVFAVVAFEIAMVQLVKERCCGNFGGAFDFDFVKTNMSLSRRECGVLCVKEHVDGV